MDSFIPPEQLNRYLVENATPEDPVLADLTRHTHLNEIHPRMLSGHILGSFLQTFSQLVSPSRILEIGTFTGYSAICLASGLKPGGKLITIEINDELKHTAREYFKKAGVEDQIEIIIGDALEIVPSLNDNFDLVFIDAQKEYYSEYYNSVIDKIPSGGYILADNVLWGGKVVQDADADSATESIYRFNRMVTEDPRVRNQILTIRDGIMVIEKL